MSTKKDLAELLSYTVKRAEAQTQLKLAWNTLSPLERVLVKTSAANRRPINLLNIRKLAEMVQTKKACGKSCGDSKPAKKPWVKPWLKKEEVKTNEPKMDKKSSAHRRMTQLLKSASSRSVLSFTKRAAGPAVPWHQSDSAVGAVSGAWKATPGWAKALAMLASAGVVGTHLYGAAGDAAKRWDRGVDPEMTGTGLNRDEANRLWSGAAKLTARTSELDALQRRFRMAALGGSM